MKAYHFLRDDMTSGYGTEPAWKVGEERTYEGAIVLCESGYHASPSWYTALEYAPGNVACIVEVTPVFSDQTKCVSQSRKLIACANVERELRLWGIECAERALNRERAAGREPNQRSWAALEVARRFADGQATRDELDKAASAASAARATRAASAAWAARAAWAASTARAARAARAASAAEIEWQKKRFNEILDAAVQVPA